MQDFTFTLPIKKDQVKCVGHGSSGGTDIEYLMDKQLPIWFTDGDKASRMDDMDIRCKETDPLFRPNRAPDPRFKWVTWLGCKVGGKRYSF